MFENTECSVVFETFISGVSLVAQSDFLSVLPAELGNDPLLAHRLTQSYVVETLPQATYYLIQCRDAIAANRRVDEPISPTVPLKINLLSKTYFKSDRHKIYATFNKKTEPDDISQTPHTQQCFLFKPCYIPATGC